LDRRQYIQEAERFFSILRLGGFALSHDDLVQVEESFRKGVPLEVLLGGLSEGVRAFLHDAAPGSRPPRRLAAYRKFIKTHIQTFRPASPVAGGGPGGGHLASRDLATELARMEFLALCEERPLEQAVKTRWLTRLQALAAPAATEGGPAQALVRLDAEMLDFYHRGLVEAGELQANASPSPEELRLRLQIPAP
jgi:hypothetical protein